MQAVADGLRDRIEADMKAAGIEIVPHEELAANDLYARFTAKYDTGIRVGYRKLEVGKGGSAGETVVYVSPRGRPFAPDCGTISPQSTDTFVRASYPLNAEFLTLSAVTDAVKSKTTEDFGINTTVTTRSTSTSQSVSFDEALCYDNAARSLEAMHRMFMLKVTAALIRIDALR